MSNSKLLILDTHIWIWWVKQDSQLSRSIEKKLTESTAPLAISSVSIYEAVRQIKRGRVSIDLPWQEWLHAATRESDIAIMNVSAEIAATAGELQLHHGDPLDRIIIATAICHDAMLASVDSQFPHFEILDGRLINGKD